MYPIVMKRLEVFSDKTGMLPNYVGKFYSSLIEFVVDFYDKLPQRSEKDYTVYTPRIFGMTFTLNFSPSMFVSLLDCSS